MVAKTVVQGTGTPATIARSTGGTGVDEQEAQATLMSVEKQVSRSLPEVWRVFSTEVHEQRALSGHKEIIHMQTMKMLADMKARGTGPTRPPNK